MCNSYGVASTILFIKKMLGIVFFIIPIGLILILSFDFIKNVIANKDDEMKKNLNVFIKRIIYSVFIFMIPTVVNATMGILDSSGIMESWNDGDNWLECYNMADEREVEVLYDDYVATKERKSEEEHQKELEAIDKYIDEYIQNGKNKLPVDSGETNLNDNGGKVSNATAAILKRAKELNAEQKKTKSWCYNKAGSKTAKCKKTITCGKFVTKVLNESGVYSGSVSHKSSNKIWKSKYEKIIKSGKFNIYYNLSWKEFEPGDIIISNKTNGNHLYQTIAIFAKRDGDRIYTYGSQSNDQTYNNNFLATTGQRSYKTKELVVLRAK